MNLEKLSGILFLLEAKNRRSIGNNPINENETGTTFNLKQSVVVSSQLNQTMGFKVSCRLSYNFLIVLAPTLASAFVIHHHATELALVFAGLLPHDGSAWGGGAARHGGCRRQMGKKHK